MHKEAISQPPSDGIGRDFSDFRVTGFVLVGQAGYPFSQRKETEKDPAADIFLGIFVFIMPYMIESPDNTYMFIIPRWNRKCHPFPAIKTG